MLTALILAISVQDSFPPMPVEMVALRDPAPSLFSLRESRQVELTPIATEVEWTEAVPSWNVDNPENAALTVEARVVYPDQTTKYYSFGTWTLSPAMGLRASVKGQKDDDGNVLTDTLRMKRPGGKLQFRLTGRTWQTGAIPRLKRLAVSFSADKKDEYFSPGNRSVWGKPPLEPPRRAQGDYPNGKVLCSPACVSMMLGYWAKKLGRQELDASVPSVESAVFDPVYGGAGNWSFNVAFAGSGRGLNARVERMSGVRELESYIGWGIPVICSVSWYLLHGEPIKDDEQGHLVVLVGFSNDGDPIFNDPGDRREVRKTYKRSDFEAAWDHSGRTTYVIQPDLG